MGLAYNIFLSVFSSLGAFLFGYDSGIISSVLAMSQFREQFNLRTDIEGAIVSTFAGGCFIGAAASGWANDKFGRKLTIQIGCVFGLWGCSMQAGASNIATMLVGRIIGGISVGFLSATVPLFNTEVSPPKIRGFLVGMTQQMIGFGFITANWVGYGCQFIGSDVSWRLPLGLQLVPAGLLLVGIQFLPNSPRWLLEVGRDDEARQVVHKIHGSGNKVSADEEFEEMRITIRAEMAVKSSRISDLWSTRAMTRRTLVAMGVQIMGQFTGINVINYFGPRMYEGLGITGSRRLLVQGIYGAVGPITNFFFILFALDKIGRKRPLQFGAGSLTILFAILAAIVASFPPTVEDGSGARESASTAAAHRAGVAMIFMMSIVFSLSFGPVSWVLASEVFPTKTRALGTSVATCSNWAMNVMISQVSPIGMDNIGWRFYLVFVALNAVDFGLISWYFPETKGRNLESEMDEVFGDHPHGNASTSPMSTDEKEHTTHVS